VFIWSVIPLTSGIGGCLFPKNPAFAGAGAGIGGSIEYASSGMVNVYILLKDLKTREYHKFA